MNLYAFDRHFKAGTDEVEPMKQDSIVITGAREHNLKNITVEIPRNKLTVITGLSGSGKSSLAFDTLFAEGQRKYVESLSAYARQFLDKMQKPKCDHITGLSPAISIEQRTAGSNPRSIVATSTEIHDYLRLLFAGVGDAHCPKCGQPVSRQSAEEICGQLLTLSVGERIILLAPLVDGRKGAHADVLRQIQRDGFVRVRVDGEIYDVDDTPELDKRKKHSIDAVIDRLVMKEGLRTRLNESIELALKVGSGMLIVMTTDASGAWREKMYSERNACVDCNLSFDELAPRNFSFNSPYGACPACHGLGAREVFDEDLLVPNKNLSINNGAIPIWRRGGRRLIIYYKKLLSSLAEHYGFDLDTPYCELSGHTRHLIMHGSGDEAITYYMRRRKQQKPFEGVIPNLERRMRETESDYIRKRLRAYTAPRSCAVCGGSRLRPYSLACVVEGKSIAEITKLPISRALEFFNSLSLSGQKEAIAGEVVKEIRRRLGFLTNVGLGYLTLERRSGTLSGGEAQRIRLATQIGAGLVGVLYVLDEPSIGLHQRDNRRLIGTIKELRDMGNTVVVVEHDEHTIREADHIIDLGPGAGRHGGEILCAGTLKQLLSSNESLTAQYLNGKFGVEIPEIRGKPANGYIEILGARQNNLKSIDVKIPLGLLVCVTGVSGSGKSSLIDDILRRTLFQHFYNSRERPGLYRDIRGLDKIDKAIVIDQSPIGRTPRSNPVTYTGAFGKIREIFSLLPKSKVRGYAPGRFSFNVKGGRCETCKGDGALKIEMHFLPDVYVTCENCGGKRYNRETLEIRYKGKNIAEVLDMTIDEALEFFQHIPVVERKMRLLADVGLGYLQLGQAATTLSGGEAQRVKLSSELSKKSTGNTFYMLDEPTTGLHFADIRKLMQVLERLRDTGNTIVVIEHNMDVIKRADYIIDLGPEGGDNGGRIVAEGTPEKVAASKESYTGRYLRDVL